MVLCVARTFLSRFHERQTVLLLKYKDTVFRLFYQHLFIKSIVKNRINSLGFPNELRSIHSRWQFVILSEAGKPVKIFPEFSYRRCHSERMWGISYYCRFGVGFFTTRCSVQNDSALWGKGDHDDNIIPSETFVRMWGVPASLSAEILHFTSFHSEWHACHLERMWEISYKMFYLGWDSSLRYRYVQNDNVLWEENRHENNVIPSEGDSPTRNPMRNIRLTGDSEVLRTSEWQ